jgi:hypothetical protein
MDDMAGGVAQTGEMKTSIEFRPKAEGKTDNYGNLGPVALCLPQIPHDQTWARTWAAALGSRQLTT